MSVIPKIPPSNDEWTLSIFFLNNYRPSTLIYIWRIFYFMESFVDFNWILCCSIVRLPNQKPIFNNNNRRISVHVLFENLKLSRNRFWSTLLFLFLSIILSMCNVLSSRIPFSFGRFFYFLNVFIQWNSSVCFFLFPYRSYSPETIKSFRFFFFSFDHQNHIQGRVEKRIQLNVVPVIDEKRGKRQYNHRWTV